MPGWFSRYSMLTLDLGVVGSSPILGVEFPKKKKKERKNVFG